MPKVFPSPEHPNLAILVNSDKRRPSDVLITDRLPDLHTVGDTQVFSLFTYEPAGELATKAGHQA